MPTVPSYLFLKWTSGARQAAYPVSRKDFGGHSRRKRATYTYSAHDESLLVVRGLTEPRELNALLIVPQASVGSVTDPLDAAIPLGHYTDLKEAYAASDLQACLSGLDTTYWDATFRIDLGPRLGLDPVHEQVEVFVSLVGTW